MYNIRNTMNTRTEYRIEVLFYIVYFFLFSAFIQTDNHLTYIGDGRDFNGIPVEVGTDL